MTLKTTVTFLKGQFGGPPPVPGMGRGYPGYSAIPQGYPGAPNMVTPGYGYGKSRYTANLSFFFLILTNSLNEKQSNQR